MIPQVGSPATELFARTPANDDEPMPPPPGASARAAAVPANTVWAAWLDRTMGREIPALAA